MTESKKPNRTGVALGVYLTPDTFAAFSKFIDEHSPRTNKTAIVEMLLAEFLTERGYLPLQAKPEEKKPKRKREGE